MIQQELIDQSNEHAKPYWYPADGVRGLDVLNCDNECKALASQIDLTSYWEKVKQILDEDGKPKYLHLATLALVDLCLPHGNSKPEIGFSVNKQLLDVRSILLNRRFLFTYTTRQNFDIVVF